MAAQDDLRREAGAMKDETKAMWHDATDAVRSAAGEQQQAAARGVGNFANALREAARNTDGGKTMSSRVAHTVADGLDRVSSSLKGRDLYAVVRDVEDFARQQPLVFFGAAVAAGFVAMRFLKSSAPGSDTAYGDSRSMGSRMASSPQSPTSMSDRDADRRAAFERGDALRHTEMASEMRYDRDSALDSRDPFERDESASRHAAPAADAASLRNDTARGGTQGPSVWPDSNSVEQGPRAPGMPPRDVRDIR